ncbi:MAG: GNAT family N-acetyltransferase [Acidimicrobiales bacterium]
MIDSTLLRLGPDRFRVVPWRGTVGVALVSPVPGGPSPRQASVERCVEVLADRGIHEVVTGALAQNEQRSFLAAGFEVREQLHLLARTLHDLPVGPTGVRIRRARRTERPNVLAVDHLAFDDFWRLDDTGLTDALDATSASRFRVAVRPGIIGYAITGRAGGRGYVQRLAVDPGQQRRGVASALIVDGLRWLRRHGVAQVVVNTQVGNDAALHTYEHLGFRRQPDGLAVLARSTGQPA